MTPNEVRKTFAEMRIQKRMIKAFEVAVGASGKDLAEIYGGDGDIDSEKISDLIGVRLFAVAMDWRFYLSGLQSNRNKLRDAASDKFGETFKKAASQTEREVRWRWGNRYRRRGVGVYTWRPQEVMDRIKRATHDDLSTPRDRIQVPLTWGMRVERFGPSFGWIKATPTCGSSYAPSPAAKLSALRARIS